MAGSAYHSLLAGNPVILMRKFANYFSLLIILLYFILGMFVLTSSRFDYLSREIKIIFSIFLFLYGGFRLARLWTKMREHEED